MDPPLRQRLNRYKPIASTESVHFKTVKPVQATGASHLNLVAWDTKRWEQSAAFQLEKLAQEGVVYCYARNDRLELNVPYELYGVPRVYEPDFLVRLANSVTVLLEIKGKNYDNADVKHQAARRWADAINHWGQLGCWDFLACRNPQQLSEELANLIAERSPLPT